MILFVSRAGFCESINSEMRQIRSISIMSLNLRCFFCEHLEENQDGRV